MLGDFSNAHTEYRDSYHEWALGKAASSARPVDRNPMGLSVDALDASAWKSESRQAMEHSADVESCFRPSVGVKSWVGGACEDVTTPKYFAWPRDEGSLYDFPFFTNNMLLDKRNVIEDPSNVRKDHRDKYHDWALAKAAQSMRPAVRNPMDLVFDSSETAQWKSESHAAMDSGRVPDNAGSNTVSVRVERGQEGCSDAVKACLSLSGYHHNPLDFIH